MHAEPAYGAVVELDGTRVHLSVAPLMSGADRERSNSNPFNDPTLLGQLAANLRPIGQ